MTHLAPPAGSGPGVTSPALLHNGLASHAQEWQRELDRAQARAWLHVTPLQQPAAAHACEATAAGAGVEATGGSVNAPGASVGGPLAVGTVPQPVGPHTVLPQGPCVQAAQASAGITGRDRSTAVLSAVAGTAGSIAAVPVRITTSRASADAPANLRATASPDSPFAPQIHVHLEGGTQGLRVWLGIPGDEAAVAARAIAVLAELRRALGADAPRLLGVVCNGRALAAPTTFASSPREDTPWPLDP